MEKIDINICNGNPEIVNFVGGKYEETKELSLSEVSLFLERDLSELFSREFWLNISFSLKTQSQTENKTGKIVLQLVADNFYDYLFMQKEVERVLWAYNKQVLFQGSGAFYTKYSRYLYSIEFNQLKKTNLKAC